LHAIMPQQSGVRCGELAQIRQVVYCRAHPVRPVLAWHAA
jgi:hypothetical protein